MATKKQVTPSGNRGRKLGGEIGKWEKGKVIEGTYQTLIPKANNNSSPILVLEGEDGSVIRYFCPKILESRLTEARKGDYLTIECLGQVLTIKGRASKAWDFDVYAK